MAGRSTLFWVGVGAASLCGACTLGTLGLAALGVLVGGDEPTEAGAAGSSGSGAGSIPTGDTPGLYPGMVGWRPSGRGVPIPETELDGAPRGLWWAPRMDGATTRCRLMLFLEDGRYADGPRPGGPDLFDLEGQRAEPGVTGVGTFEISDDTMILTHDGHRTPEPLSSGEDDTGTYFALGQLKYRPVSRASRDLVLGTWKTAGSRYVFHDDGTFESGQVSVEVNAGAARRGRWTLDGYLLMLEPTGEQGWITTVGAAVEGRYLIIGDVLHSRE